MSTERTKITLTLRNFSDSYRSELVPRWLRSKEAMRSMSLGPTRLPQSLSRPRPALGPSRKGGAHSRRGHLLEEGKPH